MKYVRKFNESTNLELQDFCNNYLAYLIDNGFHIRIFESYGPIGYPGIELMKEDPEEITNKNDRETFTWDEVKDSYIPFLQVLNSKYGLHPFFNNKSDVVQFCYSHPNFTFYNSGQLTFTFEEVVSDNIYQYTNHVKVPARYSYSEFKGLKRKSESWPADKNIATIIVYIKN